MGRSSLLTRARTLSSQVLSSQALTSRVPRQRSASGKGRHQQPARAAAPLQPQEPRQPITGQPAAGSQPTIAQRVALVREVWRARLPRTTSSAQARTPRWRHAPEAENAGHRWRSRPVLAAILKALVVLIPAAAAILTTTLLNWGMQPPATWPLRIGWLLLLLAVSTVVAMAVEKQTRRLLPLAVLFKLTLLFPDEAPSRYRMARAAANPQRLRELAHGSSPQSRAATHVLAWVAQMSRHDRHTRGHSERVRVFSDLIAEQMNISGLDRDKLRWASLLHDIGKLRVPPSILNKPSKPNRTEWDILREHPAVGMELVGPLAAWLGPWAGGIADHHERYDGTGYPNGLSGTQISLAGRIVCVADSYETMTAARSYKKPMAAAAGRAELARCAGTHFDPVVVRAFLAVGLPRLLYGIGPISFLVHLPFLTRLPEAGFGLLTAAGQVAAPVAVGLTAASVASAGVVSPLASAGQAQNRATTVTSAAAPKSHASSSVTRSIDRSATVAARSAGVSSSKDSKGSAGSKGANGSKGSSGKGSGSTGATKKSPSAPKSNSPKKTTSGGTTTPGATTSKGHGNKPTTGSTGGSTSGGSTSGGSGSGGSGSGKTTTTKNPNGGKKPSTSGSSGTSGSTSGGTTSGGAGTTVTHGNSGKTKK